MHTRVLSWWKQLLGDDPVYTAFREFYDGGNWRLEQKPEDAPTIIMENALLRSMLDSVQKGANKEINRHKEKLADIADLALAMHSAPHSRKNPLRVRKILMTIQGRGGFE